MDSKKTSPSGTGRPRPIERSLIFIALGSLVVAGFIQHFLWQVEDTFDWGNAPWLLTGLTLLSTGLIFLLCATVLFKWRFKGFGLAAESITAIEEGSALILSRKVLHLEDRLADLRSENSILNSSSGGLGANEKTGTVPHVPNQKIEIITRERVFLHELVNKLQIVSAGCQYGLDCLKSEDVNKEDVINQLEKVNANIEKMSKIIKENRDYLIIAS